MTDNVEPRRAARAVAAVAFVVLCASASAERVARAITPGTVRVDYQAPADCPSSRAFVHEVATRNPRVRLVPGGGDGTELVVRVTEGPTRPRVRGEVSVRYADGNHATREVSGDTCEAIVHALALMSAMAVEDAAPLPAAKEERVPVAADRIAKSSGVGESSARDRAAGRWRVSVGAGGNAVFGISPAVTPEATAFVDVAHATGRLWAPSARAGFAYAGGDASVSGGGIQVERTMGWIDGCPLSWGLGPIELRPCAHAEAGALAASGVDVAPALRRVRPWAAMGALGRVRAAPRAWFAVEVTGGVLAPFVRDQFYFEPNAYIFRPPAAIAVAGAALTLTIP